MGVPHDHDTNFDWLADLQKSQCYTTCDFDNPAKSTDFGADGYTASVTDWHELLQLTAPDKDCGIVFVRGDFPNTPDAILARAQIRDDTGNKGTFDIHFLHESPVASTGEAPQPDTRWTTRYTLGERQAQGIANFRWPYMQYELKLEQEIRRGWYEVRKGSYEGISFVKDKTLYQINRLSLAKPLKPTRLDRDTRTVQETRPIQFRVGGKVQFGCPCSNGADQSPTKDYKCELVKDGRLLLYTSTTYTHRLEIQVFVNGKEHSMTYNNNVSAGILEVKLSENGPTSIVSTYTLRDLSSGSITSSEPFPMIPMVAASEIENYLGVSNTSLEMTDKLWLASLTRQFNEIETIEICAVARYVEQILGVSSVPISPGSSSTLLERKSPNFMQEPGTALIRNIITSQYVTLESAFWQIRFLVKAYLFLKSQQFEFSLLEREELPYLKRMRDVYVARIRRHIQLALVWMTKAEVKADRILLPTEPGKASTSPKMNDHGGRERLLHTNSSYDQSCFTKLAVWYVMKHSEKHAEDSEILMTPEFRDYLLENGLGNLPAPSDGSESRVDKESTPKNDVLLWLETSCLLLLWKELHEENATDQMETDRVRIQSSQEHREKIVKRLRKSQSGPYSLEDEEVDRLFLLAEELGFSGLPSATSSDLAIARAQQTRTRISKRRNTEIFNCGPRSPNIRRSTRLTSNAPWELSCLNHHTLLKTSLDLPKELNVSESRDACFEFILSDYTFMVSWDRADKDMLGKWWDIEPGSVICATLIDMIGQAKHDPLISRHPTEDPMGKFQNMRDNTQIPRTVEEFVERLASQMQSKQDFFQSHDIMTTPSRSFDWLKCKPSIYYHLSSWVQSLDDTPEQFRKITTAFAPQRRGITQYLTGGTNPDDLYELTYTKEKVHQDITPEDLKYLSAFDFKLNADFTFTPEMIVLGDVKVAGETPIVTHQKRLLKSLNDSLVDQGTKYRILFAEKCCQAVVKGFICLWHWDALDTWENYFSSSNSHFSDKRDKLWTTTITLSHWKLLDKGAVLDQDDPFFEGKENAGRIHGVFPPAKIALSGRILKERSTSLVITGDSQGYYWICSVWSPLTSAALIESKIARLPRILQHFIHQQATGRCLVFLIILGHICGKLVTEYNKILGHLDSVAELEDKVLFEGLEFDEKNPDSTIKKLKKMTWGGEALRIIDDRLSTSLSQIWNAKQALDYTIKQNEGQQDLELLQEYMTVLEGFGKRYSILSNVQVRVQQKMKHIIGLRDGISTVNFLVDSRTALEDSSTTIRQGDNIRILTLITILFLPPSFVTGLFSENHSVLPNDAGRVLYAGLVVGLTLFTFGFAFFLQWDRIGNYLNGKLGRTASSSAFLKRAERTRSRDRTESPHQLITEAISNDSEDVMKASEKRDGWRRSWRQRPKDGTMSV